MCIKLSVTLKSSLSQHDKLFPKTSNIWKRISQNIFSFSKFEIFLTRRAIGKSLKLCPMLLVWTSTWLPSSWVSEIFSACIFAVPINGHIYRQWKHWIPAVLDNVKKLQKFLLALVGKAISDIIGLLACFIGTDL